MQPTTTNEFLDALKLRLNCRSDYALAKALGVTSVSMMRWRAGGAFNDKNAMHVAKLLDLPPAYVLACMGAQRAEEDMESSGVWRQIADVFLHKVALWVAVSLLGFTVFLNAPANAAADFSAVNNIHYAKFRRIAARLRRVVTALCGKARTAQQMRRASLCVS